MTSVINISVIFISALFTLYFGSFIETQTGLRCFKSLDEKALLQQSSHSSKNLKVLINQRVDKNCNSLKSSTINSALESTAEDNQGFPVSLDVYRATVFQLDTEITWTERIVIGLVIVMASLLVISGLDLLHATFSKKASFNKLFTEEVLEQSLVYKTISSPAVRYLISGSVIVFTTLYIQALITSTVLESHLLPQIWKTLL